MKRKVICYWTILVGVVFIIQMLHSNSDKKDMFEQSRVVMQERISVLYYQLQSIQYGMSQLTNLNLRTIDDAGLKTAVSADGTCHISADKHDGQMYEFETNFLIVSSQDGCEQHSMLHDKIRKTLKIAPMMTFLAGRMKDIISLYFISLDKFIITSPKYNALVLKPEEFESILFKRPYMLKPLHLGVNNLGNRIFVSGPYPDLSLKDQVITFSIAIYLGDEFYGMLNMDVLWSELSRDINKDFAIQNSELSILEAHENSEELLFNGQETGLRIVMDNGWWCNFNFLLHHHLSDFLLYLGVIFLSAGGLYIRSLRYSAKALAKQSIQDPLTGLLNRRGFMEAVENLGEHKYYSFLIMDLDDFKHVNDSYGHAVGDKVLTNFTTAVKQQIRGKDIFTRLGGEEFGLLIAYDKDNKQVNIFERICACIEMLPHYADEHEFNVTMSGGAITTDSLSRIHDIKCIMAQADALLYEAKSAGKNQIKYAEFDGSFDIFN